MDDEGDMGQYDRHEELCQRIHPCIERRWHTKSRTRLPCGRVAIRKLRALLSAATREKNEKDGSTEPKQAAHLLGVLHTLSRPAAPLGRDNLTTQAKRTFIVRIRMLLENDTFSKV